MTTNPQTNNLLFCSRCGHELGQRMANGRVRPACPACGFVVYLDPKVACGALIERDGKVLLVRRRHNPGRGLWCLPCGFEDADESPETTAQREVLEETGIHATIHNLLGVYHYIDDPRGAGIILFFRATCDPDAVLRPGDDADNAGFFAPDALPPISHHTHQAALRAWAAATHPPER